jgi:HlyD family secretion protein
MIFDDSVPSQIRIGQTSRIRLELGESRPAVLLSRGGFYQSTGGQWCTLSPEQHVARKTGYPDRTPESKFYELSKVWNLEKK